MGASLHLLHEMIEAHPPAMKDLVPSFVSILKQITEHRSVAQRDNPLGCERWCPPQLVLLFAPRASSARA